MMMPNPANPGSIPDPSAPRTPAEHRARTRRWQITWLGLGLAAVLWFGPGIYFRQMHQILEIDYQSGAMSESDYQMIIRRDTLYLTAARVGACIMVLGSVLYLLSQTDLRKHRRHENQNA